MSGAATRSVRRIEFADTDASGRAHFTSLLRHVEAVEHELLGELGIPLLGPDGGWPRVRVECDFRHPAIAGDRIEVAVEVLEAGGSSVVWGFGITGPHGDAVAAGRMVTVWVGPDGKAARISAECRRRMGGSGGGSVED